MKRWLTLFLCLILLTCTQQTPQVFRLSLYKEALCLAKNAGKQYTDDCQLIEAAGGKVYLTPGDYKNIKITTPEDLLVAEAFAAEK